MGSMYSKIKKEQSTQKLCPKCLKALMKPVNNGLWCLRCGYKIAGGGNGK